MKRIGKLCLKIVLVVAALSLVPLGSAVQPVAAATTNGAPAVSIQWEQISPMSKPRHSGATVVVNDIIYTIGGIEPPGDFEFMVLTPAGSKMPIKMPGIVTGAIVEAYNTKTDKWTTKAPLPYLPSAEARRAEGRVYLAAAAYKGKIYTFGGANVYQEVKDTVDVYDVATNTWKAGIAKLPKPAVDMSAVAYGDKIYLFGGSASTDLFSAQYFYNACYEFDPATGKFTSKATMPTPRSRTSAVVFKNRILVFGGSSGFGNGNGQLYDPATDSWSRIECVIWERGIWFGTTANDMVFLMGGRDEQVSTSSVVDVYSDQWQTWVTGTSMLTPREGAFVAAVDGKLYVMGGRDNKGDPEGQGEPLASAERGTPPATPPTLDFTQPSSEPKIKIHWTPVAPLPKPRCYGAAITVNNIIYTIGGLEDPLPYTGKLVEAYDPVANKWTSKAPLPEGRFNFGAAAYKGKIYTFGGADTELKVVDTVDVYDIASDTWQAKIAKLPFPAAGMSAATYGDKIYLFGGCSKPQLFIRSTYYYKNVYEFDPVKLTFTPKADMPIARSMSVASVVNNKIVVIGGVESTGATMCASMSPPDNTWQTNTDMPSKRGGHGGTALGDNICIVGGHAQPSVVMYIVGLNIFLTATSMDMGRSVMFVTSAAASPESIYVIGGADSKGNPLSGAIKGTLSEGEAEPAPETGQPAQPSPTQPPTPGKGMGCAKAESSSGTLSDASPLLLGVVLVALVVSSRRKRNK